MSSFAIGYRVMKSAICRLTGWVLYETLTISVNTMTKKRWGPKHYRVFTRFEAFLRNVSYSVNNRIHTNKSML